jgi:rhodanese-related sulfurtransferase
MASREMFMRGLIAGIRPRPPSVERIVAINRSGDAEPPDVAGVETGQVRNLLQWGVTVLDARTPDLFDSGHLAGAINLPVAARGTGTRAGWSVRPNEPLLIAAKDVAMARQMTSALHAVGLWEITGYLVGEADVWSEAGLPVARADSWDLDRLVGGLRRDEVDLVDVRDQNEWVAGHVPGSIHVPLEQFRAGQEIPLPLGENGHRRTTAVACAAGNRAAFAASLLRRAGRSNVVRVAGGGIADLGSRGIDLDVGA